MNIKTEIYTRPDEVRIRKKVLDTIENYSLENIKINIWPKRIKLTDSRSWPEIEKYREFRNWSEKNGFHLYPHFKRKLQKNKSTRDDHEEIIFPTISLAIYKNSKLQFVFPSTKKDIHYSVGDLINALKNEKTPEKLKNTIIEDIINNKSFQKKNKQ